MELVLNDRGAGVDLDWLGRAERIAGEIAGNAARHDEEDSFVADGFELLKKEGFLKALVPVEFGGGGAGIADICGVIRRLGAACGSTALAFSMHAHLVATSVWRMRHEGIPVEGLLKRIVAEDLVLVSTGGSDWLPGTGVAMRTEGGFLVNAKKSFGSAAPAGDLLFTGAVYEDPLEGSTVVHFAVPMRAPGVRVLDTWRTLGMRGTGSHDIELAGVFIPDAAVSGRRPAGKWIPLVHIALMVATPFILAAYVGIAEGARAQALAIARRRRPDSTLPFLAGELENAFQAAETSLDVLIGLAMTGVPGPETTSRTMIARTLAAHAAIQTVERAMALVGGASFHRSLGLERAFRDVQGARFHQMPETAQVRYSGVVALGWDIDG